MLEASASQSHAKSQNVYVESQNVSQPLVESQNVCQCCMESYNVSHPPMEIQNELDENDQSNVELVKKACTCQRQVYVSLKWIVVEAEDGQFDVVPEAKDEELVVESVASENDFGETEVIQIDAKKVDEIDVKAGQKRW